MRKTRYAFMVGVFRTRAPDMLRGLGGRARRAMTGLRVATTGRTHPLDYPAARARKRVYPAWAFGEGCEYHTLMEDGLAAKGAPSFDPGASTAGDLSSTGSSLDEWHMDSAVPGSG